jgi:hypothetical protein
VIDRVKRRGDKDWIVNGGKSARQRVPATHCPNLKVRERTVNNDRGEKRVDNVSFWAVLFAVAPWRSHFSI